MMAFFEDGLQKILKRTDFVIEKYGIRTETKTSNEEKGQ